MQQSQTGPSIAEAEDLTLFADESFDTDDIDLFEFTGEDNSPLTNLKAVILSLDWEINDAILQELANELTRLGQMWQGDKVAQIYLQGMDKIGRYISGAGAYAHPNAIKLLLTYFYDFEKIISSQAITGEEITALLKVDVRKFKILQYQLNKARDDIAQDTGDSAISLDSSASDKPRSEDESSALNTLKATILEIDWEVTDKGLSNLQEEINEAKKSYSKDKAALVLLNGLEVLGNYIREQKPNSHPEAFSLLHDFSDGLEALLEDSSLDQEQKKSLIIDRVTRLNNLKTLVAASPRTISTVTAQDALMDQVLDFDTPSSASPEDTSASENPALKLEDADEEEDFSFDLETMAPASAPGLSMEDEDEAPASTEPLTPALSNAASDSEEEDEELGFDISDQIDAHVDSFFSEETPMETFASRLPDRGIEDLPADAITPVTDEVADDFIDAELNVGSDIASSHPTTESVAAEDLDLFFEDSEPVAAPALAADDLDLFFAEQEVTPALAGSSEEVSSTAFDFLIDEEEDQTIPALADSPDTGEEKAAFAAATDTEENPDLADRLDAFFGSSPDEEESADILQEAPPAPDARAEEEPAAFAPALEDSKESGGFGTGEDLATVSGDHDELESRLNNFFADLDINDEEQPAPLSDSVATPETTETLLTPALEGSEETSIWGAGEDETSGGEKEVSDIMGDTLDSLFGSSPATDTIEEESFLTPALADTEEVSGFEVAEEETAPVTDLTDRQDAFFDEASSTVDHEEPLADEELVVAQVSEQLPADTVAPAAFLMDEEAQPSEDTEEQDNLLLTFAEQFQDSPAAATVPQGLILIQALRQQNQDQEKVVPLQLMESVLSTISAESDSIPHGTQTLLQLLANSYTKTASEKDSLVSAVAAYTEWLHQVIGEKRHEPSVTETQVPQGNIVLTSEQLREIIREEFRNIAKES